MFYAKISRGRTIRSLILVGMFAPMFLGFFAISVLGSLGIRMQRIAELALGAAPDWQKGVVNCGALGYLENTPVSADAKSWPRSSESTPWRVENRRIEFWTFLSLTKT